MSPRRPTTWTFGGSGSFSLPASARAHLMLVTSASEGEDVIAVSMLVAATLAQSGRPVLVCEPRSGRRRRAGLFSTALSRGLVEIVTARFADLAPVPRGPVCHLSLVDAPDEIAEGLAQLIPVLPGSAICLAALSASRFRQLVEDQPTPIGSVLLCAELPRDRAVAALVCGELSDHGVRCRVWRSPLGGMRRQLALAGLIGGGSSAAAARRLVGGLDLGPEQ